MRGVYTMKLKIEIKTIKGCAIDTAKKLKPFIVGQRKVQNQIWANKADDKIYWVVDAQPKDIWQITRNLAMYDRLVCGLLSSKMVLGAAKLPQEDLEKLQDMLKNDTRIRIVKLAEMPYDLKDYKLQLSH